MSQFGMQMPGGWARRGSAPDMYAALAALAVVFMSAACVALYTAACKLSPDGTPFSFQDPKKIQFQKK